MRLPDASDPRLARLRRFGRFLRRTPPRWRLPVQRRCLRCRALLPTGDIGQLCVQCRTLRPGKVT